MNSSQGVCLFDKYAPFLKKRGDKMFCSKCGSKIENANFCPQCGAPVKNSAQVQRNSASPVGECIGFVPSIPYINGSPNPNLSVGIFGDPSLPNGLFRGQDGMIRWIISRKKDTLYFYLDKDAVGMTSVQKREDTVGQAFKDMMLSGLELAAGTIARSSESYNGQDLSWDSAGDIGHASLSVPRIKKIKGNPNTGEIKLREILSNLTLYTEPGYYRYVLDYIISHAPEAQVK